MCGLIREGKGLRLHETSVTDAGLASFRAIPSLKWVDINDTKVTVSGVAKFRSATPGIFISHDMRANQPTNSASK